MIRLGKNIKKYRNKCGLTQKELADRLNLSLYSIVKYERGDREPSFANLNGLAEVFGIELSELVTEDKEFLSAQSKLRAEMNNKVISLFNGSSEALEDDLKELYDKYFFSLLEWRFRNVGEAEEFFKLILSWCPFEDFKHLTKKEVNGLVNAFTLMYESVVYKNFISNRDEK